MSPQKPRSSSISSPLLLAALAAPALFACGASGATTPLTTGGPSSPGPAASGAPDAFAPQKTGPIAPGCTKANCAEVELDTKLACVDETAETRFTLATHLSGRTSEVSCAGQPGTGGTGQDLKVGVNLPADAPEAAFNSNSVWFLLRNYTGPGTYPLENLPDDGDYLGLKLVGAATGHTEQVQTIGTVGCIPRACEAIVAEGSQPIPTDEYSTHEFRVRVEIRCARGGQLGNLSCEAGKTRCTFSETPTLLADLLCFQ